MQPNQTGVKPWQWIVTVIVIIILIVLGFYVFGGKSAAPAPYQSTATTATTPTPSNTSNGLVVQDQFPGNIVYISSVQLTNPGFVVIQTNANGAPGKIIGSQSFAAGINPGQVNLTQSMTDGSSYYAVLYSDISANGKFDATTDTAIKDASGSVIMKLFHATSNVQQVKG